MSSSQFKDFVHSAAPASGQLGLTHVTDCARLASLIQSCKIDTRHCDVFGEHLAYLFYGRPVYRREWTDVSTSNLDYARVCFILEDSIARTAHRVMPFDSGGFKHYSSAFHDSLGLGDFELKRGDHPVKLIGAFYSSMESYWMMDAASQSFHATQNVIRSYYSLITGGLAEKFDDRCAAVEVQFSAPVALDNKVLALIGPNQIFDDPVVKKFVAERNAEPRGYRLPRVFNPPETSARLLSEAERFLEDRGWL